MKRLACLMLSLHLLFLLGCTAREEIGDALESTEHPMHVIDGQIVQMWDRATCISPRTCAVCGWQDDEGLGDHSTHLGTCEYCMTFQNEDRYDDFLEKINEALDQSVIICEYLDSQKNASSKALVVQGIYASYPEFEGFQSDVGDMITFCQEYDELHSLKLKLELVLRHYPQKLSERLPQSELEREALDWINHMNMYSLFLTEAHTHYASIM